MADINLGNLTFVTLVSDANTPAEDVQYNGIVLTIPESVTLPPLGEYGNLSASGVTVHGWLQQGPGGALQWLMTPAQDPLLPHVDAIPGAGGWDDETARQGYLTSARFLIGQGVSQAQLWPGLANLYNWAKLDLLAKGWTAP